MYTYTLTKGGNGCRKAEIVRAGRFCLSSYLTVRTRNSYLRLHPQISMSNPLAKINGMAQ